MSYAVVLALGRSRGGLTSKLHLAVGGRGLPLALTVTAGNVNDCTAFPAVMGAPRRVRAAPHDP